MSIEERRLISIVAWGTFFTIPLWSLMLWAFRCGSFLVLYWTISGTGAFAAFLLLLFRKNFLFWYFATISIVSFTALNFGLALISGALLILGFGNSVSPTVVMISTLLAYVSYCIFPLKFYHDDYRKTEKDRLKSFDFESGVYDIKSQSIVRGDAYADFYTKSFLSKAHYGVIRLHLVFPISGGAIAIIAGNISKNLQLGIGVLAAILTTIFFLQGSSLAVFNAWQVRRLEKRYGKRIRILWGDEEE